MRLIFIHSFIDLLFSPGGRMGGNKPLVIKERVYLLRPLPNRYMSKKCAGASLLRLPQHGNADGLWVIMDTP